MSLSGFDTHRRRSPLPALRSLLASLVAVVGAISVLSVAPPAASADNWAPVHPGDFPDPSILLWHGVYYAYATQNFAAPSQTINIQMATSVGGTTWTPLPGSDALPTVGSWAKPGETWAPSVAYNGNEFVMYYTATEASVPGDQCIGVATSSSPVGPFKDTSPAPVVCQDSNYHPPPAIGGSWGGSIDPSIFTDPSTGGSWLIWKSDGNHIGVSTIIWSVPLSSDLLTPTSTNPTQLLVDDTPWQSGIVEGPDMVETKTGAGSGTQYHYYLFYAGSDEGASTYGIGWASCSGPAGGCTDQSTSGPLLASAPGMSGPGGPDVFTLPSTTQQPSGQMVMAFAAWQGTTIGYLSCGIRPMYLADLSFGPNGGPPSLSADPAGGTTPASSPTCPGRRRPRLDTGRSPPTVASSPSVPPASTARRDP